MPRKTTKTAEDHYFTARKSHRPHCTFCKFIGHTVANCYALKSGSDTIREAAKQQQLAKSQSDTQPSSGQSANCSALIQFDNSLHPADWNGEAGTIRLPVIKINVCCFIEEAVVRTGSTFSKASFKLYQHLSRAGLGFTEITVPQSNGRKIVVRRADDSVPVAIEGRKLELHNLLAMTQDEYGATTLGAEFLQQAGIVLNMARGQWTFADVLGNSHWSQE